MAWKTSVLVVANRTAASPELRKALLRRSERGPVDFTLVVPCTIGARTEADAAMRDALTDLRSAGVEIDGRLGDSDPVIAVQEAWDPSSFDEVIVATLPTHASRWLQIDLPHRVARITGAAVTHVIGEADPEPVAA